jgi:triosephosphate isomerase
LSQPEYLIAGNWKMNGLSADAVALAKGVAAASDVAPETLELLVCPPHLHIGQVGKAIEASRVQLGAQDCHNEISGAFTGDISAEMLADVGCSYVIVGHSERRDGHREGDPAIWAKASAALRAGLKPIVCVGETEEERLAGKAEDTVARQVRACTPDGVNGDKIALAYEPIWAIGSGRTPTHDEIAAVHKTMRDALTEMLGADAGSGIRLLYGGSVKPGNAKEIMALENVNGALVGGASLKAEDFLGIAASCA